MTMIEIENSILSWILIILAVSIGGNIYAIIIKLFGKKRNKSLNSSEKSTKDKDKEK